MNGLVQVFITSVIWFVVGYLGKQPEEAFQPSKIFFTFISAFIVGILFVGWQVPEEMGYQFYEYLLYRSGLVGVVYKLLKVAYLRSGLKKWWENLEVE